MEELPPESPRVSTLELFFDLVFVFTITQLTAALVHHPDVEGAVQVALMLAVIWWMYDAFAWLTNAVPPEGFNRQMLLLAAMGCFFAIALTIPTAFSGDGEIFAVFYLGVVAIHTGLYTQSAAWNLHAIVEFARFNVLIALLVLAAGLLDSDALEYVLWGAAVVAICIAPWTVNAPESWMRPSHFIERHGLVVIVALGESVVAVGIGASGLDLTWDLLLAAGLGLALSAAFWWSYFGGKESAAVAALEATPGKHRHRVAIIAFYWAHLLILLGVVADAAALEETIAHGGDPLGFAQALFLGGGTALFLVGNLLYERILGMRPGGWRLLAAILALATIPLGTEGTGLLQLCAVLAAVVACLVLDSRHRPRPQPAAAG